MFLDKVDLILRRRLRLLALADGEDADLCEVWSFSSGLESGSMGLLDPKREVASGSGVPKS